jgi:hypothetical protein
MTTYQALYYPFIHFRDDRWVKLAALYWDRVGRIVPNDYVTEDSDTVKALGSFVDVLRPSSVPGKVGQAFAQFITEYGPKLKERYAVSLRDSWPALPEAQRPPKPGGPSGNDPRLGYIYYEKLSEEVRHAMMDSGLAFTDTRGERWFGMHPRLAWVYMTALAEQLAAKRGLRPLTDDTRDHVAVSGLSMERLAEALLDEVSLVDPTPGHTEIETVLVSVAFQAVVPKDLDKVPVDKILEFREKYPNERRNFQDATAGLLKSREWLKSISDRSVLEDRLHDEYDKIWAAKLAELREKMNELAIGTALSCFNLKAALPAGAAAAATSMGLTLNPVASGVSGLAFGAILVIRDKQKDAKKELGASEVSYLYRMEQDLTPKDLFGRVKQGLVRFALKV